jgi:hypothetical protein
MPGRTPKEVFDDTDEDDEADAERALERASLPAL